MGLMEINNTAIIATNPRQQWLVRTHMHRSSALIFRKGYSRKSISLRFCTGHSSDWVAMAMRRH